MLLASWYELDEQIQARRDVVQLCVAGHVAHVLPNVEPHERPLSESVTYHGFIVCTCRSRSIRRTSEELSMRRQQRHVVSYRIWSSNQDQAEDMMWALGSIPRTSRPGSVVYDARRAESARVYERREGSRDWTTMRLTMTMS
jgi:hypothetical protein